MSSFRGTPKDNNSVISDDFDVFDQVVSNVEERKREEEEFFKPYEHYQGEENTTENRKTVELDEEHNNSRSPAVSSRQSDRIDEGNVSNNNNDDANDPNNNSNNNNNNNNNNHSFTPDVRDSFDSIVVNHIQINKENDNNNDRKINVDNKANNVNDDNFNRNNERCYPFIVVEDSAKTLERIETPVERKPKTPIGEDTLEIENEEVAETEVNVMPGEGGDLTKTIREDKEMEKDGALVDGSQLPLNTESNTYYGDNSDNEQNVDESKEQNSVNSQHVKESEVGATIVSLYLYKHNDKEDVDVDVDVDGEEVKNERDYKGNKEHDKEEEHVSDSGEKEEESAGEKDNEDLLKDKIDNNVSENANNVKEIHSIDDCNEKVDDSKNDFDEKKKDSKEFQIVEGRENQSGKDTDESGDESFPRKTEKDEEASHEEEMNKDEDIMKLDEILRDLCKEDENDGNDGEAAGLQKDVVEDGNNNKDASDEGEKESVSNLKLKKLKETEEADESGKEDEEEIKILQPKKKEVIFKREGDTFDDKGDRRYDISALEMVSEDECEFVNLQEVQQARVELEEYAKNLDNFNHIIKELEKTPEEKRLQQQHEMGSKSLSFRLDELIMGNSDDGINTPKSVRIDKDKTKTKKRKMKKKKKEQNNPHGGKSCQDCRSPVFSTDSHLELNEIFRNKVLCKNCSATKKKNTAKDISFTKKTGGEEQARIKLEVKAALDSRLESSENSALTKWLEQKKKEERKKKREERREHKQKIREKKTKKKEQAERLERAKQQVAYWEEKKRRESKGSKKHNNISPSLKLNSRPILHSLGSTTASTISTNDSPRSDATFDIRAENSFEKFHHEIFGGKSPSPNDVFEGGKPTQPLTYTSVADFTQSVILSAIIEIERERQNAHLSFSSNTTNETHLSMKRPKSHAPTLMKQNNNLQPRPPPKSANPKNKRTRRSSAAQNNRGHTKVVNNDTVKPTRVSLMRAKTYDEWMTNKNVQRGLKAQEREINEHYDILQQKLIELEKDRRKALVEIRNASMNSYPEHKSINKGMIKSGGSEVSLPKLSTN